jgi:hypothetical protein
MQNSPKRLDDLCVYSKRVEANREINKQTDHLLLLLTHMVRVVKRAIKPRFQEAPPHSAACESGESANPKTTALGAGCRACKEPINAHWMRAGTTKSSRLREMTPTIQKS